MPKNNPSSKLTDELAKNLEDRKWRLNNLYFIKDKNSERVLFKMNWMQEYLFDNMHYLNVILKVRQLGVTTFLCILYLDDVIFGGMDAGLIAHTLQDATKIFDTKVKYPWDNMMEIIKNRYKVSTDNVRELKFKRGKVESAIYVGTSLRSGTLQRLHLSEVSTIDQKYPAKSEEIKAGALNTVSAGQIITMESTAKVPVGLFYDTCRKAEEAETMKKKLTSMDWKFFFFPWWKHPDYELSGDIVIPAEMETYLNDLEVKIGQILSQVKRNWYFKKWETQKSSMKREYPSTPEEAFSVAVEGSYYGKQIDKLMAAGRRCYVSYDPRIPVDTWWDLGTAKVRKDACSIWFTQDVGVEIHVIDFYGNQGEGLAHYAKILGEKPYVYGTHNGPHDLEVKEIGTGKTRMETAQELGIRFTLVPNIGFADGIEAARIMLARCFFDEAKTAEGFRALQVYRKDWDEKLERFTDNPVKDWSSDPADGFRMMAVGHPDQQKLGDFDNEEEEMELIKQHEQGFKYDPLNPFSTLK